MNSVVGSIPNLHNMGDGTARGGRLPCKQDSQMGSIPISSTILSCKVLDKYITYRYNKSTFIYPYGVTATFLPPKQID